SEVVSKTLAPLASTDNSLTASVLVLLAGLVGISALLYGRTRRYFLCSRHCLGAAIGTTLVITVLYAAIWSLIQMADSKQRFVVFQPTLWSLQSTLNNLKYGSVLLLFSSALSMLGSLAIPVQASYDFTSLLNHWKNWKGPVQKLSQQKTLSS